MNSEALPLRLLAGTSCHPTTPSPDVSHSRRGAKRRPPATPPDALPSIPRFCELHADLGLDRDDSLY